MYINKSVCHGLRDEKNNVYACSLCFIRFIFIFFILFFYPGCGNEFKILLDTPLKEEAINPSDGTSDSYNILYWIETGKTVNSIYTDGTGEQSLLTLTGIPLDLVVYMPGEKLYWTEYSGTSYQIRRAGIDGSDEELFGEYPVTAFHGPTVLAIDPENAILYWNLYNINSYNNNISYSGIDAFAAIQWNEVDMPYVYGICPDTINRKLYFTANMYWDLDTPAGSGNSGTACYGNMDVAGGGVSSPVNVIGPSDDSTALRGMALDGTGGYLYYVINDSTGLVAIMRADLNIENQVAWITADGFGIQKLALDIEEGKIYWTSDTDNSIYRADLDAQNSGIEQFIQLTSKPTGIAISY